MSEQKSDQTNSKYTNRDEQRQLRFDEFLRYLGTVVLAVASAIILILLLIYGIHVWLMIFASVVFAVLLHAVGHNIARLLPSDEDADEVSHIWKISVSMLLIVLSCLLFGIFLAPRLTAQSAEIFEAVPQGLQAMESRLEDIPGINILLERIPSPTDIANMDDTDDRIFQEISDDIANIAQNILSFTFEALIIIIVGIYFAIDPRRYIKNLIRLFPPARRTRIQDVVEEINLTLSNWILARLASILVVSILTAIGLMFLGMPFVLTLAIIAGVLSFIPNLGPLLGALPAILIAFTLSPQMVVAVIVLYILIQTIESYFITPTIEQYTLSLPPALVIMTQIFAALFVGILGVLLAAPLVAMIIVIIKELYVEDLLGDHVDEIVRSEHAA